MFGSWWKSRKKTPAEPILSAWSAILEQNVAHYRSLSAQDQTKLGRRVQEFIADKDWEGCRGLELTDEIKVTVAGYACLLTLGFEQDFFDRVQTILVYPSAYRAPSEEMMGHVRLEGENELLGQAHYRGPVILAWDDIQRAVGNPGSGANLVIHEFAHQLDMRDGEADGTPPFMSKQLGKRWQAVMSEEFESLQDDIDAGRLTLLDPDGAENEAEFFAVVCECFFDRPRELAKKHKKLYELLRDYFCQDPAAWKK